MSYQVNKPYTIALFQHNKYDYFTTLREAEDKDTVYTRCSEPVTVIFQSLDSNEVIAGRVAGLDKEIEETLARAMKEVVELRQKKAELLALSFDSPPAQSNGDFDHPLVDDVPF